MERIHAYNPDMKIIAVLRDRIARAFSHWNMERERNADRKDFSFAIRYERARCEEAWPLQHRVYSYIDRGMYAEQIGRIWQYFPKSQTLFIRHEALKEEPKKTMNIVAAFLGVEDFENIQYKDVNSTQYATTLSEVDYDYLKRIFESDARETEQLLGY